MDTQGNKPMFTGNWACGTCGAAITQLPFEPSPERAGSLKCKECFMKDRESRGGAGGQKPRFEGNWSCAGCSAVITSLPFDPQNNTSNLKCYDCFKAGQGA